MSPNKILRIATPVGTARFPNVDRPNIRFDPDGIYQCDVIVTPAEAEEFEENLRPWAEDRLRDLGEDAPLQFPIVEETDREGRKTGNMVIRTKLKAIIKPQGEDPIPQRPKVVDSKLQPIAPPPAIGPGSTVRVAADAVVNVVQGKAYVTLRMRVVQILELQERGGSPESYGLEETEGYSAPEDADLESAQY